jgi:hypothetical protein
MVHDTLMGFVVLPVPIFVPTLPGRLVRPFDSAVIHRPRSGNFRLKACADSARDTHKRALQERIVEVAVDQRENFEKVRSKSIWSELGNRCSVLLSYGTAEETGFSTAAWKVPDPIVEVGTTRL